MTAPIDLFRSSIQRARNLHALHLSLSKRLTLAVDLSDLLRAEVVMVVSALDFYVHEATRVGMIECWAGTRPKTDAFNRFDVSLSGVQQSHADIGGAWLETEVRARHSHLTFQQPDKVADALRLMCGKELWNEVAAVVGAPPKTLKRDLNLVLERRNKIAHEDDAKPTIPPERWPITRADVESAIDIVSQVVEGIDHVIW